MSGTITVVHDIGDPARPDAADTLVQAEAVANALTRLGHRVETLALGLDLTPLTALPGESPLAVFNLVEALGGNGRLVHTVPAILQQHAIAYTGSDATALFATTQKPLAKRLMAGAGLPTPAWSSDGAGLPANRKAIVKACWEDASIGLDRESVVAADAAPREIAARRARFETGFFAESYIAGREFNLSLLEGRDGAAVLPPAEIVFRGYGDDRPRIVDYGAKWDPADPAFASTPRRFAVAPGDEPLLARLRSLALACWSLFGLAGYARVDFRVDGAGMPWILEVNANPCLAPDAGFVAAAREAGMSYDALIERIVASAIERPALAA